MGMIVYSSLLALALALGSPWWAWQMLTRGRYREGLAERLGIIPRKLRAAVAGRNVIWLHAVSVGEILAAERLISELQDALPGYVIAVSTTTATGQAIASERLPAAPVFFFPLDFAGPVRSYLRALRPQLVLLMESELWPRLLVECGRAGVPVVVVNARISDRSFPRYMRLRRLWKPLLAKVAMFLAQGEESAARLRSIGAPAERITAVGNLKYDVREPSASPLLTALRDHLAAGTRLVICGSTLDDEEEQILDAWPELLALEPALVLLIAPRHPQRFEEVARLVATRVTHLIRASDFIAQPAALAPGSVFLLDTLGSLAALYQLAAVAYLGGSLVPKGGHNPLEAARFGVPVVMGPSYENFREIVTGMLASNAIRVIDRNGFAAVIKSVLVDDQGMGARGKRFFEEQAGATEKTKRMLLNLIAKHSDLGKEPLPRELEP